MRYRYKWLTMLLALAWAVGLPCPSEARAGNKLGTQLRRLQRTRITRNNIWKASRGGRLKLRLEHDQAFVTVLMVAEPGTEEHLWEAGAQSIQRHGRVLSADVPVDALEALAALPGIVHMRAGRKLKPLLDVSVPILPADSVGLEISRSSTLVDGYLTYPPPWSTGSGAGVVIGVVDTGIDPDHEDFKNSDGTSRIRYLWDQNTAEVCTAADIFAGTCEHQDTDGHGTHVAGEAAGNGRATGDGLPNYRYVGVAPEAEIVGVATTFWDADILTGVAYVFEMAEDLGLPAVVNLSLGGHDGPHDGTDPFDIALDTMAGPGQIVVAAAGNEGQDFIHNHGTWSGADVNFQFLRGGNTSEWVDFTIWHNGLDSYQVRVRRDKNNDQTWPVGETSIRGFGGTCSVEVSNPGYAETENNGDKEITIYTLCRSTQTWDIWLIGDAVNPADPDDIDAWIAWDGVGGSWFTNGDNVSSVGSPGTAKTVIAVGAYTTKVDWPSTNGSFYTYPGFTEEAICPFSSMGPTRDGRYKPDITGPGSVIGAAYSSASTTYIELILPDDVHTIMLGTSMSSPHVAGLVALLLEKHRDYTPAAARSILAYSARSDSFVPATPNNTWGYGKAYAVDAFAVADQDLPRLSSAVQYPAADTGNTLVAAGSGFVPKSGGNPERYFYQWMRHNGWYFENIAGAHHRRLEPEKFAAGDLVRVVVTPYEPSDIPATYSGLLLGASRHATQTIQAPFSFASHTGGLDWCMVCIPTQDDPAILGDFAGALYSWNEALQVYQAAPAVERGKGYWVWVEPGEGDMHSAGAAVPAGDFFSPQLSYTGTGVKPGRHFMGNPYNKAIYWENTYVSTDGQTYTTRVGDAAAAGLIFNVYYAEYDNTAEAYHHYDPVDVEERDGKIFPWEGFWVIVKNDVYLKFPENQPVPATAGPTSPYPLPISSEGAADTMPPPATALSVEASQRHGAGHMAGESWRLKISASSGELRDDYNYIGVHPAGSADYDPRDIPDAGTLSAKRHVLLYALHEDWGRESGRYCVDIHAPTSGRPQSWDLTLEANGLDEPVVLQWGRFPAGWTFVLYDHTASFRVDMGKRSSYRFVPIGDEERSLTIVAHRKGRP